MMKLDDAAAIIIADDAFNLNTLPTEIFSDDMPKGIRVDNHYDYKSCVIVSDMLLDLLRRKAPEWLATGRTVREFGDDNERVLNEAGWHSAEELLAAYGKVVTELGELRASLEPPPAGSETVRVLRLVEYVGPRAKVEDQVQRSIHGTRVGFEYEPGGKKGKGVSITAVTLTEYPEVLEAGRTTPPLSFDAGLHYAQTVKPADPIAPPPVEIDWSHLTVAPDPAPAREPAPEQTIRRDDSAE